MKNLRSTLLRVFVSFGAIGLIVYMMRDKLGEAVHLLQTGVNWGWFAAAFGSYLVAQVVLGFRLQTAFRGQEIHLGYFKCLYLALIGLFFNLFLPSAIGGDVAKIYFASKHTGKQIESTSAIFKDRLMGFIAIIIFAIAGVGLVSKEIDDPRVSYFVYIFLGILILSLSFFMSRRFAGIFSFLTFLIPKKLRELAQKLYDAIYSFKKKPHIIFQLILLSLVAQFTFIVTHYIVALSLDVDMSFWLFLIIIPVVAIVSMFPSLGGLGVREVGLIFFLRNYMPEETALVMSILLDIIIYGVSFLSGLLYAMKGGLKHNVIHDMEEVTHS